jgi:hypothetical protein
LLLEQRAQLQAIGGKIQLGFGSDFQDDRCACGTNTYRAGDEQRKFLISRVRTRVAHIVEKGRMRYFDPLGCRRWGGVPCGRLSC